MAKDDVDALSKWRDAEAAYAQALTPFTSTEGDTPTLRKKDLLEMVELRGKADRWREKYFREGHKNKD
jgi:hypothetical protein